MIISEAKEFLGVAASPIASNDSRRIARDQRRALRDDADIDSATLNDIDRAKLHIALRVVANAWAVVE